MSIVDYVKAGAELLDFREPGWYNKINRGKLNMADGNACVLGQVYGNYALGFMTLGLGTPEQRFEHGFAVPGINAGEVAECKRAWEAAIEARLTKDRVVAKTSMPCDAIASFHYAMALAHGPLMSRAHLENLNGAQLLDILVSNNIHFTYRGPLG